MFYDCKQWKRNKVNLFCSFNQDRKGTIKKIADFLGKDLSDDQLEKIVEYTSLENMKKNNSVNFLYFENLYPTDKSDGAFINKGKICLFVWGFTPYQQ